MRRSTDVRWAIRRNSWRYPNTSRDPNGSSPRGLRHRSLGPTGDSETRDPFVSFFGATVVVKERWMVVPGSSRELIEPCDAIGDPPEGDTGDDIRVGPDRVGGVHLPADAIGGVGCIVALLVHSVWIAIPQLLRGCIAEGAVARRWRCVAIRCREGVSGRASRTHIGSRGEGASRMCEQNRVNACRCAGGLL